jgi:hypothetical protein
MTVARKLGEIFGWLIFSISLGFFIMFIALANFTQYTTIQPVITNIIENQFQNTPQEQIDLLYLNLTEQCKASSTAMIPLVNQEVSLNCTDVKNSQSSGIIHLISKNLFDQIYYKKYDCNFIDCIKGLAFQQNSSDVQNQQFQVIISEKSNEFFSNSQLFLIVGIAVGLVLIVISVRVWYNILKIIGVTLLFAGIVYLLIPFIKTQLLPVAQQGEDLSAIVDMLFAPIMEILRNILILGIVLTIAGYASAFILKRKHKRISQYS